MPPRKLLVLLPVLALNSCASDWDYFWNGDPSGNYTPAAYQSSGSYTPSTPARSYSDVESQDQKDRNYRQQLDKQINDAVY